jgi:hypothetical protein
MFIPGKVKSFNKYEAPQEGGQGTSGGEDRLARFEALGLEPDDLDKVLEDYVRLAKSSPQSGTPTPPKAAAPTTTHSSGSEDDEKAKEILLRLFPNLKDLDKLGELETRTNKVEERTTKLHKSDVHSTQEASRREVTRYVTGSLGAEVESAQGQKFLNTVLKMVNAQLASNADALQQFLDGDKGVVKSLLKDMEKEGMFEALNVPKQKKNTLPFLSGRDGHNTAVKEAFEVNKEKYNKVVPHKKFFEIAKDYYDLVFPQ